MSNTYGEPSVQLEPCVQYGNSLISVIIFRTLWLFWNLVFVTSTVSPTVLYICTGTLAINTNFKNAEYCTGASPQTIVASL